MYWECVPDKVRASSGVQRSQSLEVRGDAGDAARTDGDEDASRGTGFRKRHRRR